MTRALPLVGLSVLLLIACKKDGAVPAYLQIRTPVVKDVGGQEISSKITDLWVFVNDQPVGVWEPNRRVPAIAEGGADIKIVAGVRRNGIVDDRVQYPFYATWQHQAFLTAGEAVTLDPEFRYFDGLDYWLADFNTGLRFDTLDCTASLVLMPTDSTLTGQGAQFGRILLDEDHAMYRGVTGGDPFTGIGSRAYLELDYRGDTRLLIGVRYTRLGVQYEVPYVYARATKVSEGNMPWNKIYVDLAEPWAIAGASDLRFYIKAELENGATTGVVDVDNIKLVLP